MPKKTITADQFKAEFKRPKPGAYLFYGSENYIKHKTLESVRALVCPDEGFEAFNHFVFTRDNYSVDALNAAVLSVPMMSEYKLVELYELPLAEYRKKEDTDALAEALRAASESEDTVFVVYTTPENLDVGEPKRPSAMFKFLSEYATPVEFAHYDTSKLLSWVQKHFTSQAVVAELTECRHLIEVVGHDMTTLVGEINKLLAYIKYKERGKLEKLDINLICSHNKEIGAFDFADAILDGNNEKAFYTLADMKQNGDMPQIILGSIIKVYSDLYSLKIFSDAGISSEEAAKRIGVHPYVAKTRMAKAKGFERAALEGIIEMCAEADEAIKTSGGDGYIMLERLIVRASQYRKRKVF